MDTFNYHAIWHYVLLCYVMPPPAIYLIILYCIILYICFFSFLYPIEECKFYEARNCITPPTLFLRLICLEYNGFSISIEWVDEWTAYTLELNERLAYRNYLISNCFTILHKSHTVSIWENTYFFLFLLFFIYPTNIKN